MRLHVEDVELAVGDERRAADLGAVAVLPQHLAVLGVEAEQLAGVVGQYSRPSASGRRRQPEAACYACRYSQTSFGFFVFGSTWRRPRR